MTNVVKDKKYLDGEQLFKVYWKEMGDARSYLKLQKWCLSNSIVNPKTMNVPTRMGLWKAMYRWATHNRDKAFSVANSVDNTITQEWWDEYMKKTAKTSYQNVKYRKEYEG